MEDRHAERVARNEVAFRELNDRVEEEIDALTNGDAGGGRFQFVCECAETACMDMLELTLREYAHVRSNPAWFAVAPEHVESGIEAPVERNESHWIIEKFGPARRVAVEARVE